MRWNDVGETECPIARALSVLGDRWTLLVLRDCLFGAKRFEDFQASLGVSRTILSARLTHLVEQGVLERRAYNRHPERFEYALSDRGRALQGVMLMLADWGNGLAETPLVQQVHTSCGHAFSPVVTCSCCGETVEQGHVRTQALAVRGAGRGVG